MSASSRDDILSVVAGVLGGVAAYKLVDFLVTNRTHWVNKYQVGVASDLPAVKAGRALDALNGSGFVDVIERGKNPSNRAYRITSLDKVPA